MTNLMKALSEKRSTGQVYCPICTHTVSAEIDTVNKRVRVKPGQKCPRCSTSLDAGIVVQLPEAA